MDINGNCELPERKPNDETKLFLTSMEHYFPLVSFTPGEVRRSPYPPLRKRRNGGAKIPSRRRENFRTSGIFFPHVGKFLSSRHRENFLTSGNFAAHVGKFFRGENDTKNK